MAHSLAIGTEVKLNEDTLLVKEHPCLLGAVGTISMTYGEPCSYTGERTQMYSVKMPANVFGGRCVRAAEFELTEVA